MAQGRAWSRDTLTETSTDMRFGKFTGISQPTTNTQFSRGQTESTFPTTSSELSHEAVSLGGRIRVAGSRADSESDLSKYKA